MIACRAGAKPGLQFGMSALPFYSGCASYSRIRVQLQYAVKHLPLMPVILNACADTLCVSCRCQKPRVSDPRHREAALALPCSLTIEAPPGGPAVERGKVAVQGCLGGATLRRRGPHRAIRHQSDREH